MWGERERGGRREKGGAVPWAFYRADPRRPRPCLLAGTTFNTAVGLAVVGNNGVAAWCRSIAFFLKHLKWLNGHAGPNWKLPMTTLPFACVVQRYVHPSVII